MLSRHSHVLVSMLGVAVAVCAWLFPFHPVGPSSMVKSNASPTQPSLQPDHDRAGKAGSDKETLKQSELFPIYGVTLGKTTVPELQILGNKDKYYDLYKIQGFDFWYENNVASMMYLVRDDRKLPDAWTSLGFDWGLSFNRLTELLKRLGYSVSVSKPPMIKQYTGHDSFFADIEATKFSGIPTKILFGFGYSTGTTADSPGTLYNMTVHHLKK
jgi:hypothetical protein